MSKTTIKLNPAKNTIIVSKTFYNKAITYGTPEYRVLHRVMKENPDFTIEFKTSDKKTYNGLDFKCMEEYILTQDNSQERLVEFRAVMATAKTKRAKYPLTKKWFFATYPEYKENTIVASEKALNDVRAEMAKAETPALNLEALKNQGAVSLVKDASADRGEKKAG